MQRARFLIATAATLLIGCGRFHFEPTSGEPDARSDWSDTVVPAGCAGLPPPRGTVINVSPTDTAALPGIVASLSPSSTLLFEPGQYSLTQPLVISADDVVLRSSTGNAADVIVTGGFALQTLVAIDANRVVVADISFERAGSPGGSLAAAIELAPTRSVADVVLYRLALARNQSVGVRAEGAGGAYADRVTLACSRLSFDAATRADLAMLGRSCTPAVGILASGVRSWTVVDNVIDGYWCPAGEAIGMMFAQRSRDLVVARNLVRNSFVGIRFGLESSAPPTFRTYPDEPACAQAAAYVSAMEVAAHNNVVYEDGQITPYLDSGIAVWQTCDAQIVHNTIATLNVDVFSGIEHRFPDSRNVRIIDNAITDITLANNGTPINIRQGATGGAFVANVIADNATLFAAPATQDLRPALGSPLRDAGDCTLATIGCDADFNRMARGIPPDVGAFELP